MYRIFFKLAFKDFQCAKEIAGDPGEATVNSYDSLRAKLQSFKLVPWEAYYFEFEFCISQVSTKWAFLEIYPLRLK